MSELEVASRERSAPSYGARAPAKVNHGSQTLSILRSSARHGTCDNDRMSTTSRPRLTRYAHGITAVDVEYIRPGAAAAHIIEHGQRAAFVDTGTTHSVPYLLAALEELGIERAAVDFVFLTHVHLDHAGGAGALMQALPNARAVLHPRGAAHLIDPAELLRASIDVYGEAVYRRLYGEIV